MLPLPSFPQILQDHHKLVPAHARRCIDRANASAQAFAHLLQQQIAH